MLAIHMWWWGVEYYTMSWNKKITDQVGDVVDDVPEVVTVW